jgi:hypothetical protein
MGYSVALAMIVVAIVGFVVLAKRRGWMIDETPDDDLEVERARGAVRASDSLGSGFGDSGT